MAMLKEEALAYHAKGRPGKIEISRYQAHGHATGFVAGVLPGGGPCGPGGGRRS